MKKRTLIIVAAVIVLGLAGLAIFNSQYNMPHRDVQSASIDFELQSEALVKEYLTNPNSANTKYLSNDGNSAIIAVSGRVNQMEEDMHGQIVVLLKGEESLAGVSCTFTQESNKNAKQLSIGEQITVKGVIRSGANYDEDLELYEDVILEKCDLI